MSKKVNRITKNCEYCGKPFESRETDRRRFCSLVCSARQHAPLLRGIRATTKMITSECPVCHRLFAARETLHQKYCSVECTNTSFERRAPLTCQVCGKTIVIRAKFAKSRKYCSRTCRTIGIGKTESYLERKMEQALISAGIHFQKSYPYGRYTLDFAIVEHRIDIECDGKYWHSLPEVVNRDSKRDNFMRHHNWTVIRLTEDEINSSVSYCIQRIVRALS